MIKKLNTLIGGVPIMAGEYYITCSKVDELPTISFTIGGKYCSLEGREYVLQIVKSNCVSVCMFVASSRRHYIIRNSSAGALLSKQLIKSIRCQQSLCSPTPYAFLRNTHFVNCQIRRSFPFIMRISAVLSTFPAIWRSAAKQLMREAAYKAGLGYDRLPHQVLISLKPEAASLFCRQLKRNQLKTEKPAELPLTPASLGKPRPLKPWNRSAQRESMYVDAVLDVCPGQRYMVVDCGGGGPYGSIDKT
ncbi:uncharacterized protein LOC123474396 isoform X2 [Daphnia magna]|uniref:uncharacterized protein LOC123474396 isoform X2 n=1 Tax=Daphnia magna TaxID=35525 RepID=UPI001E1BB02A|nr:uncharacterized protein LOC123474396 isoform X2 [Daphnia magna]